MGIMAKAISMVSVEAIVRNPKNPNKHSKEQIARLAKLIGSTGFRNPLVVSNQSGFLVVGHGRLDAAIMAGMKEVPVIFQDFSSEADEYAYMTADNAIGAWSELDLESVRGSIADFEDFDIDSLGIRAFEVVEIEDDELPDLGDGSDADFQQVTFVLSAEQKDIMDDAFKKAKSELDCEDEINQNKNGNILSAILRYYVG